ncbi:MULTISPECIES: hypothetical protein [unclassified Salinisphaera]|uniref:hypothetical protein n=1 Tax=unclassified Salinisphaera TaxID=2649847 RepID=UPI00333E5850
MSVFSARRALIVVVAALGLGLANPAAAIDDYAEPGKPSAAAMGVDALLVRPVSLAATVVGTGLFVVSLPFSLLGMNAGDAADRLVKEPGKYTFVRPLGNFQENSPER